MEKITKEEYERTNRGKKIANCEGKEGARCGCKIVKDDIIKYLTHGYALVKCIKCGHESAIKHHPYVVGQEKEARSK